MSSNCINNMSNCFIQLIGKPVIPPYWSLGFQLSRWDYGSLSEVKKTVERNRAISLPYVRSCLLTCFSFFFFFFLGCLYAVCLKNSLSISLSKITIKTIVMGFRCINAITCLALSHSISTLHVVNLKRINAFIITIKIHNKLISD